MAATLSASQVHVSPYLAAGKVNGNGITPRDSGGITGTIPPGQAAIKQTAGTVQRGSVLSSDGTVPNGNALTSIAGHNLVPTPPTG
ncbi:MAG: hypothetical protein ACREQ5_30515, partial [Candidatus Dormibacteria bacterium]